LLDGCCQLAISPLIVSPEASTRRIEVIQDELKIPNKFNSAMKFNKKSERKQQLFSTQDLR